MLILCECVCVCVCVEGNGMREGEVNHFNLRYLEVTHSKEIMRALPIVISGLFIGRHAGESNRDTL